VLIRRALESDGNLYPEAYNVLFSIPSQFCFHEQHGMRHPNSAYGTSLRLITRQWLKLLDELDRLRNEYLWEQKSDHIEIVVSEYAELLSRLNAHLDACCAALRCLCPASMAASTPIDTRFLGNAKPPGWKHFRDSLRPYRDDHIGLVVNTLKHKQGELCPIYFKSETEFRPGYYLRDILPGGILGPSAKLHSGGDTAFSFNRDMLIHLWWIFRIGALLTNAIAAILQVQHKHSLSVQPQPPGDAKWEDVLLRCAALRPEFFPDELLKPYPRVFLRPTPKAVVLEFPTTARGIPLADTATVSTRITVDPEHRGNKMPYMAQRRDKD
jgi:hypothetical protein